MNGGWEASEPGALLEAVGRRPCDPGRIASPALRALPLVDLAEFPLLTISQHYQKLINFNSQ